MRRDWSVHVKEATNGPLLDGHGVLFQPQHEPPLVWVITYLRLVVPSKGYWSRGTNVQIA
jgi:hypothetical protein